MTSFHNLFNWPSSFSIDKQKALRIRTICLLLLSSMHIFSEISSRGGPPERDCNVNSSNCQPLDNSIFVCCSTVRYDVDTQGVHICYILCGLYVQSVCKYCMPELQWKDTELLVLSFLSSSLREACILGISCHLPCNGYPPGAQQSPVSSQLPRHTTCPR